MMLLRILGVAALLGSAPPLPAASSAASGSFLRAEDHRIAAITYRLAKAGAPFCSQTYPLTGLLLHHLPEYEPDDRPPLIARYGLDRGPGVLAVLEDSPAARAGLAAGDVLLAVNGRPFPAPASIAAERDAKQRRSAIEASETVLEAQLRLGPAKLLVLRDGEELEVALGSSPACPGRVRLARSSQTNAFATGRYVVMTTGLLSFTQDEDELAIVIAHELAHNILDHPERLDAQNVPRRGLLRGFGKNAARVRATEEEADRLGIKLAWAAGYDVSAAIPFWRRYYAKYDSPQLFRTHPGLRARERLIAEAIAELGATPADSGGSSPIPLP